MVAQAMKRCELAQLLWRRHLRVEPPDAEILKTWITEYSKAALERAFALTAEQVASQWFNHQRVMSEDDAAAYAAGVLRHNA